MNGAMLSVMSHSWVIGVIYGMLSPKLYAMPGHGIEGGLRRSMGLASDQPSHFKSILIIIGDRNI